MGHFYTLNPRTGEKERLINAEYYPAFLMLPEIAFVNYPSIVSSVNRYPRRFLFDKDSRAFVASNNFLLCIIDFYAFLAWPVMAKMFGLCKYMECYSGYDIAWQIAHAASLWVTTMEEQQVLPKPSELFENVSLADYFGFVPLEEIASIMERIVPIALEEHGLDKVIEVGIEYRCMEDFEFRNSNKRTDFLRKWYHSRTKIYRELHNIHDKRLLEKKTEAELLDEVIENDSELADKTRQTLIDPENWNVIHMRRRPEPADDNMIDLIETQVAVNDFLMQLPQEDYELLMLGFEGKTQMEIAEALHLETHSAVSKRRKRLISEFERFSGVEINKKAIRRKKK